MDARRLSATEVERMARLYQDAETQIRARIERALARGNSTKQLDAMLAETRQILADLNQASAKWAGQAVPKMYRAAVDAVDAQTGVSGAFGTVHKDAMRLLADNVYSRFSDVNALVGRRVNDIYRTITLENVTGSLAGYDTWKQAADGIVASLDAQGVVGFVDKAGREWSMSTYAEMAARTTTMQTYREGARNRIVENTGSDLAEVTGPGDSTDGCADAVGLVFSLTGQTSGYPTLDEIEADYGLFHPNCVHSFVAYVPEGA